MIYHTLFTIASTYGSGSYGNSTYNGASGSLSDTGIAIAGIVTVAALILLTALVIKIWRRPKRVAVPIEADDDNNDRPIQ